MTPEQLLHELRDQTYVMLRPSSIEGIGVFALRDIPKGCRDMFSPPLAADDYVPVPRATIDQLPAHARRLVETYCLYDAESYYLPGSGFKKLDLVHFLNHSDTPNVASVDDGNWFVALRDIVAGEELLVDYGELVEDEASTG